MKFQPVYNVFPGENSEVECTLLTCPRENSRFRVPYFPATRTTFSDNSRAASGLSPLSMPVASCSRSTR